MGRRRIPRIYEIELDDFTVKVKSIQFGKVRKLIALMDEENKDMEVMDGIAEHLAEAIVAWDLTDEEGRDIEPSREAIDDLEFGEVLALTNKWLDIITGPSDELGKGSSSGVISPVALPTMEAL